MGAERVRTAVTAAAILAVALGAQAGPVGSATAAGTLTVSGVVYWDQNDDGVQQAGEPGVPGVVIHWNAGAGTPKAVTGADGSYSLSGLPSGGTGKVVLETGWFRSQCAKLSCAAGPGTDNDFSVANQFIQLSMAGVAANRGGVDVGLLPDWPGSTAAPPAPQAGVVMHNAVDVAARLSWVTSTCTDGTHEICRVGDTYTVSAQILNQGTTALTGIHAVLAVPGGDDFATGSPAHDVALNAAATAPGITGMSVGAETADGEVPLSFSGSLVPGGVIRVTGKLVVRGGTGTPGCVSGAPTAACPTAEPYGAPLMFAVTDIDQVGDPDSFGPGCNAAADVRACPTGIHDKQAEPDEVDPVGHNVAASVGGSQAYDLTARVVRLSDPPSGGWEPGDTVTWRVSATNTGPGMHVAGWTLTLLLPKSSTPVLPAANVMRSCAKGMSAAAFPFVRCTGKGPLSPGVTSFAIDVVMHVPPKAADGTVLPVLAYVTPASGQPAETVPLGTAPTNPSASAGSTTTDNDSSSSVTTG
jgi:hypothetical protein